MFGETKKFGRNNKKLCKTKQVTLVDGKVCKDHIHMYVAITSKTSVWNLCHI